MADLIVLVRHMPHDAAYCLADWRRLLGEAFGRLPDAFERVTGRVTGTYPDKTGNYMYEVRRHGGQWLGVPSDRVCEGDDSPGPVLSLDDVQLWRLSASGWRRLEELAGIIEGGEIRRDERDAEDRLKRDVGEKGEIYGDFKLIKSGRKRIDLAKKYKARAFLRFVHGYLKGRDNTFYVEEMRVKFNRQFGEGLSQKQWTSERFREDLFKGVGKDAFDALFETVDQASGLYRLKI